MQDEDLKMKSRDFKMPQDPKEREIQKKIEPAINRFVQEIDKAGLSVSALIFDPNGDFLIRCGNTAHQGKELVKLHYYLSIVCATLEAEGYYSLSEQTKAGGSQSTSNPQETADRLALALMQVPSSMIPDRILELAREYAEARRP